ncbi:MAG TPA: AMP-binding protein, partial [Myxococcota bacterium]|nr:AMP-binding protein [Myxococcota bacterium]
MPRLSYGRALARHAAQHPDRPALRLDQQSLSFADLDRRANRLARAFAARGVGPGALVTLALPNSLAFYEACLAVWRLGATPQPVSARLPERERRAIVELARPALVVGAAAGEEYGLPSVPADFVPDPALPDDPLPDVVPRHVRAMTSGGSTGRPKLIVDLTPAECDPDGGENGMTPGGVTLVPGPLYHAGPFITSWNQILCGGTAVVMARFDAEQALALIERHRVDWVLFVPTMMQRIWRLPETTRARYDLSSLRRVMCTGAPNPVWLKRAWIEWLGPERIYEAYGGTERSGGTMISGMEWLAHPGSVGRPTGGRRIRVLRPDGSECGPGEVGELYMMPPGGQGSTYRYVGAEPTATADGWETLGDLGYLDAEGWLYLVERKVDMILVGGANVYPAEVEAALDEHPAVRSSAVIGLPDEDLGNRVHAIVDTTAPVSAEALRAHLAERLVAYKVPRSFEFVSELLRDDAGKLRRSALREARLSGP